MLFSLVLSSINTDTYLKKCTNPQRGNVSSPALFQEKRPAKIVVKSPLRLACHGSLKAPLYVVVFYRASLDSNPAAAQFFEGLANSHKKYYTGTIEQAKTTGTRTRRIEKAITDLQQQKKS